MIFKPDFSIALMLTSGSIPLMLLFSWVFGLFLPEWIVTLYLIAALVMNYLQWINAEGAPTSTVGFYAFVFVVYPVCAILWPASVPSLVQGFRTGELRWR